MADVISNTAILEAIERIIAADEFPTLERLADGLECDAASLEVPFFRWWSDTLQTARAPQRKVDVGLMDVPQSINEAFSRIWNEALSEAYVSLSHEQRTRNAGAQEVQRDHEDEIQRTRAKLDDAEDKYRIQVQSLNEAQLQIKTLEAEVKALKASLVSETGQRKDTEHKASSLDHELVQLRRALDDQRRTYELRLKDEQRNALETVSKSEADVRYYRNSLEKVREESGKKESALTKTIHDVKAEMAKRDVKIESQHTQIKSLESELKNLKLDHAGLSRDIAKLNSSLLSETNKNKRLEEKVAALQEEVRVAQQKKVATGNEAARRENSIRNQLTEREDELVRMRARNTALEKRVIALDEELRRAKAAH